MSTPLRPILALRNIVALGFQQIDLIQIGLLAHLHDSDTEVPEHGRGAAVLLARFPVAGLVHKGLPFHGADTQAADDDVDVDIPGTVVTVRVGADDGGMTGELFVTKIYVDGGATLKRMRPAPQGRGYRIRKRSNHVTLFVGTKTND